MALSSPALSIPILALMHIFIVWVLLYLSSHYDCILYCEYETVTAAHSSIPVFAE